MHGLLTTVISRIRWWWFTHQAKKRCSVHGCREHKVDLYTMTVPAYGGIAVTKKLVVLCRQHKEMVEAQSV